MGNNPRFVSFKELITRNWNRRVIKLEMHPIGCMNQPLSSDEIYESVVTYGSAAITPTYNYNFFFFDFDNSVELTYAQTDTQKFVTMLMQVYEIDPDMLGIFFSGQKGFHVLIPAGAVVRGDFYEADASTQHVVKVFADTIAGGFHSWDRTVYDGRRIMRIANSVHHTSGLYKIPISYSELMKLFPEEIKEEAHTPRDIDEYIEVWHGAPPLLEVFTKCEALSQQVAPRTVRGGALRDYFLPAKKGERNVSAAKLAGLLRKGEVSLELAQMIMQMWNRQNEEPLETEELSQTVHKVYKRY